MRTRLTLCRSLVLLLGFVLPGSAYAINRPWPGVAPCDGSLNQCIAGAASGDVIEIATNVVTGSVNANLNNKSLTIRPAMGFEPVVANGFDWAISLNGGICNLRVTGLTFDGTRLAAFGQSTGGSVEFDHLRVNRLSNGSGFEVQIAGAEGSPSAVNVSVHDNTIVHESAIGTGASILLATSGAEVSGQWKVYSNTVTAGASGAGTFNNFGLLANVRAVGPAAISLDIFANRFLPHQWPLSANGGFFSALSIYASEAGPANKLRVANNVLVSSTSGDSNFNGSLFIEDGADNTYTILNNTILGGKPDAALVRFLGAATGQFRNNIVVGGAAKGIDFRINALTQMANSNNVVFGSPANSFTPGPTTITTDPAIRLTGLPRLTSASPAIGSGSTSAYLAVEANALGAPIKLDSDGLRRIKGSAIDIGALEFGDDTLSHDTTGFASTSTLNFPAINGNAGALMHISRSDGRRQDAEVVNPRPMSQSYGEFDQRWSLRADDNFNLNTNAGFTLFNVVPGGDAGTHVATAGTIFSGSGTSLPAPWATMPIDSIFLISATRGAGLSITPNPHPFGAAYISGQWRIINTDSAAMPVGAAFTVYAQAPSPIAFEHMVTTSNLASSTVTTLDHPRLNAVSCANPHVSISGNGQLPVPLVSVHYNVAFARWQIRAEQPPTALAIGNKFFVVIDPKSSEDGCRGDLFADGFE